MQEKPLEEIYNTVRVPLIQPQDNIPQGIGGLITQAARDYLNCFVISDGKPNNSGGQKTGFLKKRTGSLPGSFDFSSVITGSTNNNGVCNLAITSLVDVYVGCVYDATNSKHVFFQYRPNTGVGGNVKIGELTSTAATDLVYLTELNIANVTTLGVVIHKNDYSSSKGFYATSSGGVFPASSLTEITDTDFPPKKGTPEHLTGPMVQMNGTTYVMTRGGAIYNSDLNTITSWNSAGVIQANQYPDLGIGLLRYKHHILAFGDGSIQFFNDVGNPAPASPLQRTDQAFIKFGCIWPKSFININDVVYFLSRGTSGSVDLYKLDGYSPVILSGAIESSYLTLFSSTGLGSYYFMLELGSIQYSGRQHIIIGGVEKVFNLLAGQAGTVFTSDPFSLVYTDVYSGVMMYNIEENDFWYYSHPHYKQAYFPLVVNSTGIGSAIQYGIGAAAGASAGAAAQGINFYKKAASDSLYSTSITESNLSGTSPTGITIGIQLNALSFVTEKRKFYHKIKLISKYWPDVVSGDTRTSPFVWVVWNSKNNLFTAPIGINYINKRAITMPNVMKRYYINNAGSSRLLNLGIICKSDGDFVIEELEFDISLGTM